MQSFATIVTQWIDGNGAFVDLKARLGRLGDDVAAYALHTLGWVRMVRISRYSEFAFDARSVRDATAESLIAAIRKQIESNGHQLVRVEVFDGQNWLTESGSEADRLIGFIRRGRALPDADRAAILHQIPYAIDRVWTLGDPQVRAVAEAWRAGGGFLNADLDTAVDRDCPDRSVKIMVPDGASFRFERYRGSRTGPWDREVWNRFAGETVQDVVPDPMLAQSVVQAAQLASRSRLPRLERCNGPVLASGGVRHFAWYRLTLPVWRPGSSRDAAPYGVLMALSPDWREDDAA